MKTTEIDYQWGDKLLITKKARFSECCKECFFGGAGGHNSDGHDCDKLIAQHEGIPDCVYDLEQETGFGDYYVEKPKTKKPRKV